MRAKQTIRQGCATAFTLVEMLVVVSILVILISLVLSVANTVRNIGQEQLARADMSKLMAQVRSYHDLTGKYPPQAGSDPDTNCTALMKSLMTVNSIAAEINERFPGKIIGDANSRMLTDAFGKPFNYLSNGGPGGTPVLISAGPDRQWNTPDDIRSDERQ